MQRRKIPSAAPVVRLERDKLARENELLKAKQENLEAMKRSEAVYEEALQAFRSYRGETEDLDDA